MLCWSAFGPNKMELLPYLQDASEYSALITVFLWGLVSLQIKFQASKDNKKQADRQIDFEKSWGTRFQDLEGKVDASSHHTDEQLRQLERTILEKVGRIAERVSQIEGRINQSLTNRPGDLT